MLSKKIGYTLAQAMLASLGPTAFSKEHARNGTTAKCTQARNSATRISRAREDGASRCRRGFGMSACNDKTCFFLCAAIKGALKKFMCVAEIGGRYRLGG